MQVPGNSFDADSVALMGTVCEEVWREVRTSILFLDMENEEEVRRRVVGNVLAAVAMGERDPERLRTLAYQGIDG